MTIVDDQDDLHRIKGKRILIGSAVRQTPEILGFFLDSLAMLECKDWVLSYYFVDNNDAEKSRLMLEQFATKHNRVTCSRNESTEPYLRNEKSHYWTHTLVWKVAEMKNQILEAARQGGYDYLFLVDSDLVLHPYTLQKLISGNRDIIANIFWTQWSPESPELPQVWLEDDYRMFHSKPLFHESSSEDMEVQTFLQQLREPGIYEVGGLGACTLLSKNVLDSVITFTKLPNVSFWGEDRHFCIRAAALGFKLYVDSTYPAYHLYREQDLDGVEDYVACCKSEAGRDGITVSLCMIVKNEENILPRCLESVCDVVDELIIVDTGSTDQTVEVAKRYGARVFEFEWIDDFAAARNYAFQQATQEYILWLDADDYLKEKDRGLFRKLTNTLSRDVDSVLMHTHLAFDQQGNVTHSLCRNRLVKRNKGFRWEGFVHECLMVSGQTLQSDIAVTHQKDKSYTDRNLRLYRSHLAKGAELSPRDMYYFANELKDHGYWDEAAEWYERFLLDGRGWLEDVIGACIKQANCYGQQGNRYMQKKALLRSFEHGHPRPDACCALGAVFMEQEDYVSAVTWFKTALTCNTESILGLVDHASYTWLPYLQLCVCYDRMGDRVSAYSHHLQACSFQPEHPSMVFNQKYFAELGYEKKPNECS
ncbi:hypothetical protein SY83_16655 [Paenibacillus swuensis]|uniref:Glycosyltransferase 2-like domain-containing protein n=1 Tax=Paenibacillus swuensis TaxID=1178515 RepID=A0A172TL58_9BACL|nr:glycosyltransferase [Paenibacillus swuensis]ANE47644.1 hypothetical protein SY83_16655 [Paenibacillus swuensis]